MRQNGEPKQTLFTPLPVSKKKKNRTCTLYAKEIIQLLNLFFSFSFVLCAHCDGAWLTLIPFHSCNLLCIFFSLRSLVSHSLSPVCRYIPYIFIFIVRLLFVVCSIIFSCLLWFVFLLFDLRRTGISQHTDKHQVPRAKLRDFFQLLHPTLAQK